MHRLGVALTIVSALTLGLAPSLRAEDGQAAAAPEAAPASAPAAEPPAWAQHLRLVIHGGPIASDVEVSINGAFVIEIQGEPEWFHEIADLLKPGLNELTVTLKKPEAPREAGDDLRLEIREVAESSRKTVTKGQPLTEMVVPAGGSSDSACAASVRFWAGPPPGPRPAGLKNDYWLYATGPSARVSVAVFVNDQFVYETSSGQTWFDITPFVRKGKNATTFQMRPTCLVPETGRTGSLVVGIGPAHLVGKRVEMVEPPQAEVEIDPKRDTTEKVVKRSFRAW